MRRRAWQDWRTRSADALLVLSVERDLPRSSRRWRDDRRGAWESRRWQLASSAKADLLDGSHKRDPIPRKSVAGIANPRKGVFARHGVPSTRSAGQPVARPAGQIGCHPGGMASSRPWGWPEIPLPSTPFGKGNEGARDLDWNQVVEKSSSVQGMFFFLVDWMGSPASRGRISWIGHYDGLGLDGQMS